MPHVKKLKKLVVEESSSDFWAESTRMLLRYSILTLYAAKDSLTLSDLLRFLSARPLLAEEAADVIAKLSSPLD